MFRGSPITPHSEASWQLDVGAEVARIQLEVVVGADQHISTGGSETRVQRCASSILGEDHGAGSADAHTAERRPPTRRCRHR